MTFPYRACSIIHMDKVRRYCDVKVASKFTGIKTQTLYDWASQRRIPSIKIFGLRLFELEDLDKLLQSLKTIPDVPI